MSCLYSTKRRKVRRAETRRPHVLTFVALGGEGKTSLVAKWAADLAHDGWPGCDAAFAWSFYSQGTREQFAASSDLFLKEAITFFVNRETSGALISVDAHPLLREYFARQLRTRQPESWRSAHRRLYEHLCSTTRWKICNRYTKQSPMAAKPVYMRKRA